MSLLNDRQLNDLLRLARLTPPKPAPDFRARVMEAYQKQSGRASIWRRAVSGAIRIPIPAVIFASIALVILGMALGSRLGEKRVTAFPGNGVRQDRPVLSLYGLEPVQELRPRIVRRRNENR